MADIDQWKAWKKKVYPALVSKSEEFTLLGYDRVTADDVWDCLMAKLERTKEDVRLHQLVNAIFKLSANEYMNWLTIRSYKSGDSLDDTLSLFE